MSNDRTTEDENDAARDSSTPPAGEQRRSTPAPEVPPPVEELGPEAKLARDLAAAQTEGARLRDQLLRTAADFDNFRKRSRREVEEAARRGREAVIKDLLPVFDNLERATVHAEGAPDARSVAEGLRIVLKQFIDTLDKMGIKRVAAVGLPFDPSMHEAISHVESAEHPAGVIVAEVQPGYAIGDHLVRAALVVVSKGPPADPSDDAPEVQ